MLDTCVLKLTTLPNPTNPAAVIVELALRGLVECWVSPAMLAEHGEVLAGEPELLEHFSRVAQSCHPLFNLEVIRHEPDNRFLECAVVAQSDFLITVNTKRGHFDRAAYGKVRVLTPGRFLNLEEVQPLLHRLHEEQDSIP